MEVAIITDTHFGVRNDNVAFMDMTKKFLDHVFFPEIDKRGLVGFRLRRGRARGLVVSAD